jgi:hypothetical protein
MPGRGVTTSDCPEPDGDGAGRDETGRVGLEAAAVPSKDSDVAASREASRMAPVVVAMGGFMSLQTRVAVEMFP